jgi:NAD(P) transhydrogenase subunit alpha
MPTAASAMYARNITALLLSLISDGALALDGDDELLAGVIVTRDGAIVHPALSHTNQPEA